MNPAPNQLQDDWNPRSAYAVALLTLIYALNFLDRQVLALVLPQISRELHMSDTVIGLIVGAAFVLFYTVAGVPIARLADRSNRRNILAVGLAFWSIMTVMTGAVSRVWQLVVTRFLMGLGEASCIAPSTSMISDMFRPERRALPMAIFTSGSSIAALLFFPLAGWISQHYGWRIAFVAAGVPGILLALLLWSTVAEPARGRITKTAQPPIDQSFGATLQYFLASRVYVLTVLGGAFIGTSMYASLTWNPTFLTRVHHFNQAEVGASIGLLRGSAGIAGALLGGFLVDRLSQLDVRWRLWTPGLACIAVMPAELLFLLPENAAVSLVGLALASLLLTMHLGPVYAVCQNVAPPDMRATATAGFLLIANLVGQILGPLVVGVLNDYWAQTHGTQAVRYSLIFGAACAGVGGILLVRAAAYLETNAATPSSVLSRETT